MRIVCPQCQAAYKVDLPDLDESGMDVKCAKCQHIFLVKEQGAPPQGSVSAAQANIPSGENPNQAPDEQQDEKAEAPLSEEYLEDLMDEFVQQLGQIP